MSAKLIIIFIIQFVVAAILAGFDRNLGRFLYFTGAALLNFGILYM